VPNQKICVSLYSICAVLSVSCGSKFLRYPSGVWGEPQPKSNFVRFALKADIWWQQFYNDFPENQLTRFRAVGSINDESILKYAFIHDRLTWKYRHAAVVSRCLFCNMAKNPNHVFRKSTTTGYNLRELRTQWFNTLASQIHSFTNNISLACSMLLISQSIHQSVIRLLIH